MAYLGITNNFKSDRFESTKGIYFTQFRMNLQSTLKINTKQTTKSTNTSKSILLNHALLACHAIHTKHVIHKNI